MLCRLCERRRSSHPRHYQRAIARAMWCKREVLAVEFMKPLGGECPVSKRRFKTACHLAHGWDISLVLAGGSSSELSIRLAAVVRLRYGDVHRDVYVVEVPGLSGNLILNTNPRSAGGSEHSGN